MNDSTTVDIDLGHCQLEQDPDVKDFVIGIPQEYFCEDMSDEVIKVWSEVTDFLEQEGIKVVPVSMPHTKYSITCYQVRNFIM